MYFKYLPLISLVLSLLITTQNIYTSEHPKQNAQMTETVLPDDTWSQIAMYIPAHPFINEISRKKQLSQDVYSKMIKSYIKNTCNDYFSKDEIEIIIKKHFNTKFIPKDKIKKALEEMVAANPLANYKRLIDSGDLDQLKKQINYKFFICNNFLSFYRSDLLNDILNKLTPQEIFHIYKNISMLQNFLVHVRIYVSNPNDKIYNALKNIRERTSNTSLHKVPLTIGSMVFALYCMLWVQFLCRNWNYFYTNPDEHDYFTARYVTEQGVHVDLIDRTDKPFLIFMSGLTIFLMTEFTKKCSEKLTAASVYGDNGDISIWLNNISEGIHQLLVSIRTYINDHHASHKDKFNNQEMKCAIYSMIVHDSHGHG